MAIVGAHQSIAGGYYKAVETAHRLKCDCVQVFAENHTNREPRIPSQFYQ